MRPIFRKAAVLLLGAAALAATLAVPASADPSGTTDIALVGSGTTQFLGNDLANDYNYNYRGGNLTVGSWNATNPTTGAVHDNITLKPGVTIVRPDSSSEGISAVQTNPNVDIARSSRGARTGDTGVVFVREAQDTVQYALSMATATNGFQGLGASQLRQIYTTQGITWDQFAWGLSTHVIQAMIPQPGSGLRASFLGSLGITDESLLRPDLITVRENDPTPIQNNPDALAPFSLARYRTLAAPAGSRRTIELNSAGYSAVGFVYNVTRDAGGFTVPGYLQPFLNYVCSTAGQRLITKDGFDTIPTCGVIDHL